MNGRGAPWTTRPAVLAPHAGDVADRAAAFERRDEFVERPLALALHDEVDLGPLQGLLGQQRGVDAAPHDRHVAVRLDDLRHVERVAQLRARWST